METTILAMEKAFNDIRISYVKEYLCREDINYSYLSKDELLNIYDCLYAKAIRMAPDEDEDEDEDDYYDWDYNEDEGFDPYEGGYTFDC